MEKYNFNKLFELENIVREAKSNYFKYSQEFVKLFKSRPKWQSFLTHYCTRDYKGECWVDDIGKVGISIKEGTKPNTIVIEWDNTRCGDFGEQFETRNIPIETLESFLYEDTFFTKVFDRLKRIKDYKEKIVNKNIEEIERKEYERLKAKYENN